MELVNVIVHLLSEGANLAIVQYHVNRVLGAADKLADRGDNSSRAGAEYLLQLAALVSLQQLIYRNLALLYFVAPLTSDTENGAASNTVEDSAVQLWSNDLAVNLEEDVHGADFTDPLMLSSIGPENLIIALLVGYEAGMEAGSVVCRGLGSAETTVAGAGIFVLDHNLYRSEAVSIVGSNRGEDDEEGIGLADADTQERISRIDEGTDVEALSRAVGDPVLLDGEELDESFVGYILRQLRDIKDLCGAVQTSNVVLAAEENRLAFLGDISLAALENSLTVVESGVGRADLYIFIGNDAGTVPAFLRIVVHAEHVVGEMSTETDSGYVHLFLQLVSLDEFDFCHLKKHLLIFIAILMLNSSFCKVFV